MHLCMYVCMYVSKYLYMYISIYLYIYIFIYLAMYLSIHLSIYLSIYLSIHPSTYLAIHLSIYLFIYLSIHPSIHLYTIIYIYHIASYTRIAGMQTRVNNAVHHQPGFSLQGERAVCDDLRMFTVDPQLNRAWMILNGITESSFSMVYSGSIVEYVWI